MAVTNFLTPRSSGYSAFRAGSHMATGSLPLLTVLSLSTKAMLSNERKKQGQAPSQRERILLIPSARAIVETLGPVAGGGQAVWERNKMKLPPARSIALTTLGKTAIPD